MLIVIESASAIGYPSARHVQEQPAQGTGKESPSAVTPQASWQKVDAVAFSLFAPSGWEFHQLQGVDSYVGEFVGDGIVLTFDFGRYSSSLNEAKKRAYVIAHESIGHGLTSIYFRKVGHSNGLCLWGKDLTSSQPELALKIFETIRFGNAEHLHHVIPPPPPPKSVQRCLTCF
jgi:hypothetical protein